MFFTGVGEGGGGVGGNIPPTTGPRMERVVHRLCPASLLCSIIFDVFQRLLPPGSVIPLYFIFRLAGHGCRMPPVIIIITVTGF